MAKIIIRADGGEVIGLGHIIRTLTLAKELQKKNEIIYLCKDGAKYKIGMEKIKEASFDVYLIPGENVINSIINIQKAIKADLLITDSYDVDEIYFTTLKNEFKYLGYIDDVNICKLDIDFVINQNIYAKALDFKVGQKTKLFLGPQYSLVREEFRIDFKRDMKEVVNDILITVGGMDRDCNTLKIISLIENLQINIHVVIGSAFCSSLINALEDIKRRKGNVYLYKNANMKLLMEGCQMAISACGSTLYELAIMQVPTIGIVVSENQQKNCEIFTKNNIIIGTYDWIYNDIDRFKASINMLISNFEIRKLLVNSQKNIVNINGARILAREIESIFN